MVTLLRFEMDVYNFIVFYDCFVLTRVPVTRVPLGVRHDALCHSSFLPVGCRFLCIMPYFLFSCLSTNESELELLIIARLC